ncbi:hypothetical protein FSP39_014619 [Pinctada imbricata]|uniref:Reverse transcriptase domain-containing protein n=1 Tax=Pinctada imbricata TaxID=66713 RepID=A0AA88YJJ8_PINIB|nr:hypothetical protein FSP39_014619 [Pinctada imbricata]
MEHQSLYTDTESCVRLGNRLTDWFSCRSGVKQGDNLSPTIFSLFINDLAIQIKALNKGVPVGDLNISILLYADDIALITQNEKDMQDLLNTVESWCKQWRLKINTDKTKVVHFRKRQRNRSQLTLKLNGRDLSYESSYKYLGVIFDEFASFKDNAENLAKSAGRALGSVISKIHGIKSVGFRTFEKLFLCGVAPIIDYCSGVWGHKEFHNLHSVQLKAMRYFLGVHRFTPILAIQGESGWPPTVVRHRVNVLRLWNRLTQMDADRVTRKIFEWDLTEYKPGSWSSQTNDLFASLGLDSMFRNRQPCDISASEGKLIDIYKDKWNSDLATVSKLRTYRLFKTVFKTEDYLYMNIPKSVRSTFSMFRCGILPLRIETGRFRGESPDERLCTGIAALLSILRRTSTLWGTPESFSDDRLLDGVQPLGVNKIKNLMKVICDKAGLVGNFTNHSGKRTCATQLYLAGVDEQEIMGRTGHRSEKAVRKDKRSSEAIAERVSAVLDPPEDPSKMEEMDMCASAKILDQTQDENVDQEMCTPAKRALADLTNQNVFQNCSVSFNF